MKQGRAISIKLVTSLAFLYLVGLLAMPASSPAVGSTPWKDCRQLHYQGERWVQTEARLVGCKLALRITRRVAFHPSHKDCPSLEGCELLGFKCPFIEDSGKIVCFKGKARTRMRPINKAS